MRIGILPITSNPVSDTSENICAPNKVVLGLAREFEKLGHETTVFCGMDCADDIRTISNSETSPLNSLPEAKRNLPMNKDELKRFNLSLAKLAIEKYKSGEIDLINCHHFAYNQELFIKENIPVIYTIHESIKDSDIDLDLARNKNFYFTAISKEAEEFILKNKLNYAGYTPNGIDEKLFQLYSGRRDSLLYIGRVIKHKKIREALEAAKLSGEKIVVIGPIGKSADAKEYFEDLKKEFFSQKNFIYHDQIVNSETARFYQRAKALILISKSEGMPLSALESLSCGTPVIASAVGGLKDMIVEGVNGFLLKDSQPKTVADKIKKLDEISVKNCRKTVEDKFTITRSAKGYIEAYSQFLSLKNR